MIQREGLVCLAPCLLVFFGSTAYASTPVLCMIWVIKSSFPGMDISRGARGQVAATTHDKWNSAHSRERLHYMLVTNRKC